MTPLWQERDSGSAGRLRRLGERARLLDKVDVARASGGDDVSTTRFRQLDAKGAHAASARVDQHALPLVHASSLQCLHTGLVMHPNAVKTEQVGVPVPH